jgi:hypothetical protein
MTVRMPFGAGVRTRAQDENPGRPNLRRQLATENGQRNRFPSHYRRFFASQLGTYTLDDTRNFFAEILRSQDRIERFK